jgi:hypothetical protein
MAKLFNAVDENMVTWMAQLIKSRSSNTGQQEERFWTNQSSIKQWERPKIFKYTELKGKG